jgi:hypothetical protein
VCGPIQVPNDVDDTRADGIVPACSYDFCLCFVGAQCLIGGEEPGAQQNALRTQHQRRGKATPVSDSTGCHHHNIIVALPNGIDNRRHEGQGRPRRTVAAALCALGDDYIRPDVNRFHSVRAAPALLIAIAKGFASPNESITAAGL